MEAFRLLITLKLNFSAVDSKGNTALHVATKNGNTKMVYKLLLQGLSFKTKNYKKETAQSIAKSRNFNNIMSLFVSLTRKLNLLSDIFWTQTNLFGLSYPSSKASFYSPF